MGTSKKKKKQRPRKETPEPLLSPGQDLLARGLGILVVSLLFIIWLVSLRQYHRHGVVTVVDAPHQTLTLRFDSTGEWSVYTWSAGTKFSHRGVPVRPESLEDGTEVGITFRGKKSPFTALRVEVLARPEDFGPA
ncbi:hypothetical protein J0H58_11875 [bacterium]|nr:hypothetical protein [bacterium]